MMSEKVQVLMIADRTPLALVLLGKDLLALPRIVQVGRQVFVYSVRGDGSGHDEGLVAGGSRRTYLSRVVYVGGRVK